MLRFESTRMFFLPSASQRASDSSLYSFIIATMVSRFLLIYAIDLKNEIFEAFKGLVDALHLTAIEAGVD